MENGSASLCAFVPSKGGAGATFLAVNASALLAREKRVLLADFHMCNSSVLRGFEDTDKGLIAGTVDGSIPIDTAVSLIPTHPSGLRFVCVDGSDNEQAAAFLSTLSGSFDVIVSISRDPYGPSSNTLGCADRVYLVTTPELTYLKSAVKSLKGFYASKVPSEKIKIVLNRSSGKKQEEFNVSTVIGVKPAISVPEDIEGARNSVNSGQLLLSNRTAGLAREIAKLVTEMAGVRPEGLIAGRPAVIDPLKKDISIKNRVHSRLIPHLKSREVDISGMLEKDDGELNIKVKEAVEEIFSEEAADINGSERRAAIVNEIIQEAIGLGPLEDLLDDETVSEIMVNSRDLIYVERAGKLELSSRKFSSDSQLLSCIERIVAPIGRRIDESSPMVDARLPDGSRVNAVIPPLALKGPCLTIRKFSKRKLMIEDLIKFGSITTEASEFLRKAVSARRNIVVSGGTGSGKTTLLNVISSFIPEDERIVTIEDSAELSLAQEHVVILESRPANIEGSGAVTIRDLVKNALRMRPDRIIVGECRSGEALDMLQAMNTGHDGSLTTLHSNSPRDTLSRLETMVLMAGMDLPLRAIREQISGAVDIIVHQERFKDGKRRITHITEVCGMEGDVILTQDVFKLSNGALSGTGLTI